MNRLGYDAVVDCKYIGAEDAIIDDVTKFVCVASALSAAPTHSTKPHVIFIQNGRYYEKLAIRNPFITLIGESKDETILTFDDASDTKKPDGTTYGTFASASVSILASDICIENLTIENGFDYPANAAKSIDDPTRFANGQAVALQVDQGGDRVSLKNVSLVGYQDTLYVNAGKSYFEECYIAGHIDFIFGAGRAVFQDCDIVSRDHGYITAASTLVSNPYGFLFVNCRLKRESAKVAEGTVALGRPWHPTTLWTDDTRSANPDAVGCVVFKDCWMDSHVAAYGWDRMHGWDKDRNQIWFYPQDARFFEYGSTGPGAIAHETRRVLSKVKAQQYSIDHVLDDWHPERLMRLRSK